MDRINPDECPHMFADFVDVVFSDEFQYEQRYCCKHCLTMLHFQIGPFGMITNRRDIPNGHH